MRITQKDLDATIKRFERETNLETTLNKWHKHVALYTKGPGNSSEHLIAHGTTVRECHDKLQAILQFNYIIKYK